MLITRQDSTSGSDMQITPRINTIPTITNYAQNEATENNIVAL